MSASQIEDNHVRDDTFEEHGFCFIIIPLVSKRIRMVTRLGIASNPWGLHSDDNRNRTAIHARLSNIGVDPITAKP